MTTLTFEPLGKDYEEVIIADKIVRFSKSEDGEITFIHLTNGEVISSSDSIKTLEARLNSED